jgi:hypothetical protein
VLLIALLLPGLCLAQDMSAEGETPLMEALRRGEAERATQLVEAGADLTASDDQGMTVLMYALRHGNEAVVEAALDAGADLTAQTKEGVTVLFLAAGAGDLDVIRAALEAGADVEAGPEQRSPMGPVTFTPLMAAAMMGRAEAARLLLGAGADPRGPGDAPIGPLTMAAMRGDAPIVHLLLEAGADPETRVAGIPLVDIIADPEAASKESPSAETPLGKTSLTALFGMGEGQALVLALLRGRGDEPEVVRAVDMSEEARGLARTLFAWLQEHQGDPRLRELFGSGQPPTPDQLNAVLEMAGLSSEDGPLVGEHGTYMLALSLFADELAVVGTHEATEFAVEAILSGDDRRDVITLQASRSGAETYGERAAAHAEDRREAANELLANEARRIATEIQEWARKPKAFGGGNDGIDESPEDDLAGVTLEKLNIGSLQENESDSEGAQVYSNHMGSFELGTNSSGLACDDPPVPEGASSTEEQVTLYAYNTDRGVCVRIDLHGTEEEDIATAVTPGP